MAWFPIDPHDVTPEWMSDVLAADVRTCRPEQIGIGVGLLGRVFRVHLTGGARVPDSVVVKLPTLDLEARSALAEDLELYLTEVNFYDQIGLDNPLRPPRSYFTAFDPVTHDFILVLEDLGGLRVNDQIAGCPRSDAETVLDAIADHHAHWWESDRFATMPWLKTFDRPPFPDLIAANFEQAWPIVVDGIGADLPASLRTFGDRFRSLVPWYCSQISRGPCTYLHGDLRLDQLFFAVRPGDPPVTALDWQISARGRGAYDVAYFLSQSLTVKTRRECEDALLKHYADRLAQHGIDYPPEEFIRDYRLSTAMCFTYPVLAAGRIDPVNDRQVELLRTMLNGAVIAIEDNDALALGPD